MTVKDLIEKLSKFDDDTLVKMNIDWYVSDVDIVEEIVLKNDIHELILRSE